MRTPATATTHEAATRAMPAESPDARDRCGDRDGPAPLEQVRIDHTRVDLGMVDHQHRLPVGRPWVTLAIDVCSRMITGLYLSLEDPSPESAGLCIAHSVLPKDEGLARHDIDAEWPVWGFPHTVHMDRTRDFRCEAVQHACAKHGVHVTLQPVERTHFGARLEKLAGGLMDEIQALPGAIARAATRPGDTYEPDEHAWLTLSELEHCLLILVAKIYHHSEHPDLGRTPLAQWKRGMLGPDDTPGTGAPVVPMHADDITRDFMPAFERAVTPSGIHLDGLAYDAEALHPWINAPDPEDPWRTRRLVVRRDPRDVSRIWVLDPDTKRHIETPTAGRPLAPISVREYHKVRKRDAEARTAEVKKDIDAIVREAEEKTRKARRDAELRDLATSFGTGPITTFRVE